MRLKRSNQSDELENLRDATPNWEYPLGYDKEQNWILIRIWVNILRLKCPIYKFQDTISNPLGGDKSEKYNFH